MKKGSIIYSALCLLCCLLPFVGMTVARTDTTTENKALAEFPDVRTETGINAEFLSELGDYFTDHFAFREALVSADSMLCSKLFGISNMDTVLVGKNDWLYYTDTLDDYLGRNTLSERGICNAANNIRQLQEYVNGMGKQFLFTVAPNKNSLYGDNMPAQEQHIITEQSNIDYLTPKLEEYGVSYLNLFELFEQEKDVLYYQRDSHWNNTGALKVYRAMLDYLQLPHDTYENADVVQRKDYIGDLNSMLYPLTAEPENNDYYDVEQEYCYVTPTESVEDAWIQTQNMEADGGSLLMYRDSFGNSLIPWIANSFQKATFSKMVPYNIQMNLEQNDPDVVIVEKVERNLDEFAYQPPVFEGAIVPIQFAAEPVVTNTTLEASEAEANTMYWQISGVIDSADLLPSSKIYVRITDGDAQSTYEAFTTSTEQTDNGYLLYLKKDSLFSAQASIEVIVEQEDGYQSVLRQEVDFSVIPTMEIE